jgi:hypothetical protein
MFTIPHGPQPTGPISCNPFIRKDLWLSWCHSGGHAEARSARGKGGDGVRPPACRAVPKSRPTKPVHSGRRELHPPARFSQTPLVENDLWISTLSLAAPQQRDPCTDLQNLTAFDSRLARLCAPCSSLPEHVVLAILALIDSASPCLGWQDHPRETAREDMQKVRHLVNPVERAPPSCARCCIPAMASNVADSRIPGSPLNGGRNVSPILVVSSKVGQNAD